MPRKEHLEQILNAKTPAQGRLAASLGGRLIPSSGHYAMLPSKLRQWQILVRHGFSVVRRGGVTMYRQRGRPAVLLYEALRQARALEDVS